MVEFHDFPNFTWILHLHSFLKKLLRHSGNSSFSHPRGQAAQKLVKPMEFHPFLGVLGAFGRNFRKSQPFHRNDQECWKHDFLADFYFLHKSIFSEMGELHEHLCFAVSYWGFREPNSIKCKNSMNAMNSHEILAKHRFSDKSMVFCIFIKIAKYHPRAQRSPQNAPRPW